MKNIIYFLFIVCTTTSHICLALRERFDDHRLLTVTPTTIRHLKILSEIDDVDFWDNLRNVGHPVRMLIRENQKESIENLLNANQIHFVEQLKKGQVQEKLDDFWSKHNLAREENKKKMDYEFDHYLNYEEIENWMTETAAKCTRELQCEIINIGKSYEDRNMHVFKMSTTLGQPTKRRIWIDSGIHAREWISPATAMFAVNSLLNGFLSNDADTLKILTEYEIHALLVVNPDGYAYTHTDNRMWRKTRSITVGSSCVGVDNNRNFDFQWGTVGISTNPCSETYCGEEAFSEVEAKNQADYVMSMEGSWDVFITLHSFGQLWMAPWGYTLDVTEDYEELMNAADKATTALTSLYGTTYEIGTSSQILYQSSGTSRDWAKGVPKIPYVYTIELRDRGNYGFLLPPEQIIPTGEETWAGLKTLFLHVIDKKRSAVEP